ncbi:MAG: PAS domain S-box protein [Candidatus Moduliflexus flocculans]|nr:PAS domain S-box protein [Candidatus Moduliflexus flocculans]
MVQTLQGQGQVRGYETEFYTSTGEIRMVTISAEMIMLSDEQCMIATIEDVTEKKTLEKEILGLLAKGSGRKSARTCMTTSHHIS